MRSLVKVWASFSPDVDSRSLGRFLQEAQVSGQLDHPGIVPVHEPGVDATDAARLHESVGNGRGTVPAPFKLLDKPHEGYAAVRHRRYRSLTP